MSGARSLSVKRMKGGRVILAGKINGTWGGMKISKNNFIMKNFFTIFLLLGISCMAFAQKKTFQIETGLTYPIGLEKDGNKENHIGFYANGIYNFSNSPLSAKLRLSYDSYTVVMNEYSNSPFNGRSVVILPSINYNFPISSQVEFYAGAGVGITLDNMDRGVFNNGKKCHTVFAPQLGVNVIKHFNISAQYNITHKDFSRLMLSIGYIF